MSEASDEAKNNSQNATVKSKPKELSNEDQSNKNKRVVFQEKPIILNKTPQKISESIGKLEVGENEKGKEKKERTRPPTKVVVRRLPPTMNLETFIDNVSPLPEHDFIYFVRADMSLGPNAFSRAYINFVNMDDLLTFYDQFDNYVFMDSKGNEFPAVVEFAPFQRVPKKRPGRKKDPKVGTLKDDPAFMSFVASLQEKDTSSVKQTSADHLLTLTSESPPKKDMSTPLLEFIKQRRAERQRMREEKREERKRKELERKRIKEEEKKRRKDGDSVLKVLRNPEHEDKDDPGRNGKERDRSQQMMKKREEERKLREKERKERREVKGREGTPKTFRDDRQKQVDGRVPRKGLDDQRRKIGGDRQISPKVVDGKHCDYDKSSHVKETDTRKLAVTSKDIEQKKGPNERFQFHNKENDKYSRDTDVRKVYRDGDIKRSEKSQGYSKDTDYRRGSYSNDTRRNMNAYEPEGKKKNFEYKSNFRNVESTSEVKQETNKSQTSDDAEGKKWELLGAKPKRKISDCEYVSTKDNEALPKSPDEVSETPERRNSVESVEMEDQGDVDKDKVDEKPKKRVPGFLLKRRCSLESDAQNERKCFKSFGLQKPKRQTSLDAELFLKDVCVGNKDKCMPLSKSQEFTSNVQVSRRSSLDSNDYKREGFVREHSSISEQVSEAERKDFKTDGKAEKKSEEGEDGRASEKTGIECYKYDGNRSDSSKAEETKASDFSSAGGTKRDPRVERRIRNKDRPSIEIYRPGMGRFSMQRKEREKNAVLGSSTEQESPSNSPSPTPSGRGTNNNKGSKTATQELRSMTFKRSVSREK